MQISLHIRFDPGGRSKPAGDSKTEKADCRLNVSHPFAWYLLRYLSVLLTLLHHKALELARGIEPPTCGLQNHCSAIELRQPCCFFAHLAIRVKRGGVTVPEIVLVALPSRCFSRPYGTILFTVRALPNGAAVHICT